MFDPNNRILGVKEFDFENLKRGKLMRLTFDLETMADYISEYGDCGCDFAGNYLNSAQIFPRRPEWGMIEVVSPIIQRLKGGPFDYDSPERMPYHEAVAQMAFRIEQFIFAYSGFNDPTRYINFRDHNAQFRHGVKDDADIVIDIPLRESQAPDAPIVNDVRYHPLRQRMSYAFDLDPASRYYEAHDNLYYQDDDDKRLYKWVTPRLSLRTQNGGRFDIPRMRTNLHRIGFDPRDTTFLYARGTPSSKQRLKNDHMDVRDLIYWVAQYGSHREDAIRLGKLIDPRTGKLRATEALSEIMGANTRFANVVRFYNAGAFMPLDHAMYDPALAHGAVHDAMATAAAENLARAVAMDLWALFEEQSESRQIYRVLVEKSAQMDKLPVWSLPRREGGYSHEESAYWFLDTDDQEGRFKQVFFLHVNGTFHKKLYNNKLPHELDIAEWIEWMSSPAFLKDPDRCVRVESINTWPHAMYLEDVLKKSSAGSRYRHNLSTIKTDCDYIASHPDMWEKIKSARAEMNRARRFESHSSAYKNLEDELPAQYSGEVHYQNEAIELERRRLNQEYGSGKRVGILETIRNGMQNTYGTHMLEIDGNMRQLFLRGHPIDSYRGLDSENLLHENDPFARIVFDNWKDTAERVYRKFRAKKWEYLRILDEIKSPITGHSYFTKGKFTATSLRDAFEFRRALAIRFMGDYLEYRDKNPTFAERGLVDRRYSSQRKGKDSYYLLIADPDNGEKGATAHIADEYGREISLGFIKAQNESDVLNMLEDRLEVTLLREGKKLWRVGGGVHDVKGTHRRKRERVLQNALRERLLSTPGLVGLKDDRGRFHIAEIDLEQSFPGDVISIEGREFTRLTMDETLLQLEVRSVHFMRKDAPWYYRFYRLGSEPTLIRCLQRFKNLEIEGIPDRLNIMYEADTRNRLDGLPSETEITDRYATRRQFERDLARLEISATTRDITALERDENPRLGEAARLVQHEEGQRILAQCGLWIRQHKEKYPPQNDLIAPGMHDPDTGAPYDYIPYLITRNSDVPLQEDAGIILLDVPTAHARYPINQAYVTDLPERMLAIPNISEEQRNKIKKGLPVVVREIETGVLYHVGPASLHKMPPGADKSRPLLLEKIHNDYTRAGMPLNDRDIIYLLGIEDMYPLVNTRDIDASQQSFQLPHVQFMAAVHPAFVAMGKTRVTSTVIPVDYCPQILLPDKPLRLRETEGRLFDNARGNPGPDTGHTFETTLRHIVGADENGKVQGVTLSQLFRDARSGVIAPAIVQGTGAMNADQLENVLRSWAADSWKGDAMEQRVLLATFDPVNDRYFQSGRDERHNAWAFFNALSPPDAALTPNGLPISPSVYRKVS